MRQKKRCSFCTDKKRWRDCRKRSDKSCPTPHSAPFLALFRVAGRQKDALAGNGVLEQRYEPGEHNADHDLQQVNQPPGPLITNCAATGMWYTIKVRLAKSRPVPWLTVQCAPPAAAKAPCCARGFFLCQPPPCATILVYFAAVLPAARGTLKEEPPCLPLLCAA